MDIDLRMFSNHSDSNKIVVDYLAIKIDISRKDNIYYIDRLIVIKHMKDTELIIHILLMNG